jgi:hypothetical protein
MFFAVFFIFFKQFRIYAKEKNNKSRKTSLLFLPYLASFSLSVSPATLHNKLPGLLAFTFHSLVSSPPLIAVRLLCRLSTPRNCPHVSVQCPRAGARHDPTVRVEDGVIWDVTPCNLLDQGFPPSGGRGHEKETQILMPNLAHVSS